MNNNDNVINVLFSTTETNLNILLNAHRKQEEELEKGYDFVHEVEGLINNLIKQGVEEYKSNPNRVKQISLFKAEYDKDLI